MTQTNKATLFQVGYISYSFTRRDRDGLRDHRASLILHPDGGRHEVEREPLDPDLALYRLVVHLLPRLEIGPNLLRGVAQ